MRTVLAADALEIAAAGSAYCVFSTVAGMLGSTPTTSAPRRRRRRRAAPPPRPAQAARRPGPALSPPPPGREPPCCAARRARHRGGRGAAAGCASHRRRLRAAGARPAAGSGPCRRRRPRSACRRSMRSGLGRRLASGRYIERHDTPLSTWRAAMREKVSPARTSIGASSAGRACTAAAPASSVTAQPIVAACRSPITPSREAVAFILLPITVGACA